MVQEDSGVITTQELDSMLIFFSNFFVIILIIHPAAARSRLRQALERRPKGPYLQGAAYFNPFVFYWPNSYGRYIQWFQDNIPNYPSSLPSEQNEPVLDHMSQLMGYWDKFDIYCFLMEPRWRDMMSRLKMDRLQCEYQIGE
jgi:hypothetical protein